LDVCSPAATTMYSRSEERLAKKVTAEQDNALQHAAERLGSGLGTLVNQVESQWKTAKTQRDSAVRSLLAIREKVNALLAEAGHLEIPAAFKRKKRSVTAKAKATGSAVPPAVKATARRSGPKRTTSAAEQTHPVDAPVVQMRRKTEKKTGRN
jgi:hypothetical protein